MASAFILFYLVLALQVLIRFLCNLIYFHQLIEMNNSVCYIRRGVKFIFFQYGDRRHLDFSLHFNISGCICPIFKKLDFFPPVNRKEQSGMLYKERSKIYLFLQYGDRRHVVVFSLNFDIFGCIVPIFNQFDLFSPFHRKEQFDRRCE